MNPSILITPNAVKEGKLYSIIPTDGAGDLGVVRATSATRVNSAGLIEIPVTNLVLQSETFDNVYWNKNFGTITANDTIAPNGTLTADLFTKTSAVNTVSSVTRASAYPVTGVYTLSVFMKPKTGNIVLLRMDTNNTANAVFNFTTKTFTNSGANVISSSYEELPNGWFRLSMTSNVISTGWNVDVCNLFTNPTNDAMWIWGAQIQEGITATEYIPTTTVVRTRFAGITQDGSSASNIPRLDYSNGSCPSILVEPQRTNLVLRSKGFEDNTAWLKTNATIIGNTTISPSGVQDADTITVTSIGNLVAQTITVTASTTYTLSFYVLRGSMTDLKYSVYNLSVPSNIVAPTSYYSQTSSSSWVRVSVTFTTPVGCTSINIYPIRDTGVTGTVFLWGVQLEVGSNATSYIPTTTATVTRNADVISKSGISSLIGQTEGSVLIKGSQFNRGVLFLIRNNTSITSNVIRIFCTNTGGSIECTIIKNNNSISTFPVISENTKNNKNIVISYSQNSFKVFISGKLAYTYNYTTPIDFSLPLNTIEFGSISEMGTANFDFISLWKTQLSDAQALQLTTL